MSDIDVHHLAAAYTLDALDLREREAFEAHYEGCDVCRLDVLEFRDTMSKVASSLSAPPPTALKNKVLAEIAVTRQLSPNVAPVAPVVALRRRPNTAVILAAAAAIIALVVGVVALTGRDRTTFADDLSRMLDQPDARMIDLPPQDGVSGTFKVAWSPSMKKAALIGENLPTAPIGKAYELWLIAGEQSMAMYVLDPAKDGEVHRMIDAPEQPTAWAITMEPDTGSPVATGDIIYIAEV